MIKSKSLFSDFKVKIPKGFEIATFPPFYRETKNTIQVLGTESLVWDWNLRDIQGECTHRNCRSNVRFFASKPRGHVFFFDIDEKPSYLLSELIKELENIVAHCGFSHFILTKTKKGFHVWITEIRQNKIDYFRLFQNLKASFKSDYEFHGQWILRLGQKPNNKPPIFVGYKRIKENTPSILSGGHLTLLERYASMPRFVRLWLSVNNTIDETFARQVNYHSFDVHGDKIDDTRF